MEEVCTPKTAFSRTHTLRPHPVPCCGLRPAPCFLIYSATETLASQLQKLHLRPNLPALTSLPLSPCRPHLPCPPPASFAARPWLACPPSQTHLPPPPRPRLRPPGRCRLRHLHKGGSMAVWLQQLNGGRVPGQGKGTQRMKGSSVAACTGVCIAITRF